MPKSGMSGGGNNLSAAELAAYINGMVDGLPPDSDSPEIKVLRSVADAITKLVDEVAALAEESERMREYLDELDCDLGQLEADYYGCEYDDCGEWLSGVDQNEPIIFSEFIPDAGEHGPQETGSGEDKS